MLNKHHPQLHQRVEDFLSASKMGASYFGKAACGNSEVVPRLRDGRRVWPETEQKLLGFIDARSAQAAAE